MFFFAIYKWVILIHQSRDFFIVNKDSLTIKDNTLFMFNNGYQRPKKYKLMEIKYFDMHEIIREMKLHKDLPLEEEIKEMVDFYKNDFNGPVYEQTNYLCSDYLKFCLVNKNAPNISMLYGNKSKENEVNMSFITK